MRIDNEKYDNLTILDVDDKTCRWATGRSQDLVNQHLFCGRPTRQGVYCDWHRTKAYDRRLPALATQRPSLPSAYNPKQLEYKP